ncbi:hypothetical protein PNK_0101 [Candidatus Protochlamydia naegleriophila]|uniref:Uncharacterized protein n=1 Tax=Candidatus Protochlamydia naegleriophila TaxID=389348 RepID=A0A0U5K0V4_9BACT|nr:prepilin-type N-terminal cleavage/methylation domain-containing protein [Candidatus Protochlamydia naegleriophila]CUI15739.1 hypothetical protein PNK_0101 [Candidatus Protochlamydia naegleriophila]
MRNIRQAHFTLLELLIVLLILSLGIALTGVKLKEAYEEQRFFSECGQVIDQLRMAQELMLVLDSDVEVRLAIDPETKQVTSNLAVEKPLNDAWVKLIERKLSFSAIRSYKFDDNQANPLVVRFSLGNMSKGKLVLSAAEHSRTGELWQETIDLIGYPSPIGKKRLSQEADGVDLSQRLYPAEVYEELYPEPGNNPIADKKK